MSSTALAHRNCSPRKGAADCLTSDQITELRGQVPGWLVSLEQGRIEREFRFPDYHRTMAFVNALAWIAHRQDHHPDLEVSYNRVRVVFSTHDVDGLSENDFICAARVDALET